MPTAPNDVCFRGQSEHGRTLIRPFSRIGNFKTTAASKGGGCEKKELFGFNASKSPAPWRKPPVESRRCHLSRPHHYRSATGRDRLFPRADWSARNAARSFSRRPA